MIEEPPVLVDSNVFIVHLRAGEDPIQHLLERFPLTDLVTCGVVKAEVLRGVRSVAARDRLCGLFEVMRFVDTNGALWDEAWNLAWTLDREGISLPLADHVIASCALRVGARVLTNDRHFDHFPDLVVIRP